jgi:hypothetical protein
MRSVIAGVVGGLSGGATVLVAMVTMGDGLGAQNVSGHTDGTPVAFAAREEGLNGAQPSPPSNELHSRAIASSAGAAAAASEPGPMPIAEPAAWTMPEALTDAGSEGDWSDYARPDESRELDLAAHATPRSDASGAARAQNPDPDATTALPSPDSGPAPVPSAASPEAPQTATPAVASATDAPASPAPSATVTSAAPSADPLPESAREPEGPTRVATAQPAREPDELRALRSFRLHVPKELPAVDLVAPTRTSMATLPPAPKPPSARIATARAAPSPPSSIDPAASANGQDSLKRASDAVKRLARRMGGGHAR